MKHIRMFTLVSLLMALVSPGMGALWQSVPTPTGHLIEIEEYQGVRLGSVEDFRENSISGVQAVDPATYKLRIDGLVERPQSFSLEELAQQPRAHKLVELHCVEGWSVLALWEGIALSDLLGAVTPQASANTLIFHAQDGYTTSLPLSTVLQKGLIIADKINGVVLPPEIGFPFQLVAEEKWGYKWIRWITRIELSNDGEYRGYWESKGYSNDASFPGPKFDDVFWRSTQPATPTFR